MHVSELAKKLEVTADTVRYYTRIGYLDPPTEFGNNYRDYGSDEERCLRFILSARRLGFFVEDIGELLQHADRGDSPCPLARDLIVQRLKETERRFLETQELRKLLTAAVAEWAEKPDREPSGEMICHLIEDMTGDIAGAEKSKSED